MGWTLYPSTGVDTIPNYLKAQSPRRLRQLMLRNNVKHRGFVEYQDIQWVESEGMWYAWYNVRIEETDEVNQIPREENS